MIRFVKLYISWDLLFYIYSYVIFIGRSRTPVRCKMKPFVTRGNNWKAIIITIITRSSILNVIGVLNPPSFMTKFVLGKKNCFVCVVFPLIWSENTFPKK